MPVNCIYCHREIPDGSQYCNYCGQKQVRSTRRKANGTGSIYKRGSTYTAKHRVFRAGRCIAITKGGFKTKREAQLWLNENSVLDVRAQRQTPQSCDIQIMSRRWNTPTSAERKCGPRCLKFVDNFVAIRNLH